MSKASIHKIPPINPHLLTLLTLFSPSPQWEVVPLSMRGSNFFVRPVRNSRSPWRQNAVVIRQQSCNTVARLSPFFGVPLLSRCLQVSLSFSPIAEICRKHLQFLFERKSFLYAPPVATSRSMDGHGQGCSPQAAPTSARTDAKANGIWRRFILCLSYFQSLQLLVSLSSPYLCLSYPGPKLDFKVEDDEASPTRIMLYKGLAIRDKMRD